eukprot:COSAG04_NODE_686_length_11156_cov_44.791806_11_plen_335_part_00
MQRREAAAAREKRLKEGKDDKPAKSIRITDEQQLDVQRSLALASGSGGAAWVPTDKVSQALAKWMLQVDLLSFLPEPKRRELLEECDILAVKAGETVLKAGDAAAGISILFTGECAIYLPESTNQNKLDVKAAVKSEDVMPVAPPSGGGGGGGGASGGEKKPLLPHKGKAALAGTMASKAAASRWKKKAAPRNPHQQPKGSRKDVRRYADDGSMPMVELQFGPAEVFGEHRAFHNVDGDKVRAEGLLVVSATIKALKACQIIVIKQPPHITMLKETYSRLQEYKIAFLRRIPHYKYCSDESLELLARNLRRCICEPREVLAHEGEEASTCFFIM